MANNMIITLKSSNGDLFHVEKEVAGLMKMIHPKIVDGNTDAISLGKLTSDILIKIIDYCKHHANKNQSSPLPDFDINKVFCSTATAAFDKTESSSPFDFDLNKVPVEQISSPCDFDKKKSSPQFDFDLNETPSSPSSFTSTSTFDDFDLNETPSSSSSLTSTSIFDDISLNNSNASSSSAASSSSSASIFTVVSSSTSTSIIDDLKKFDEQFMIIETETLFDISKAAHYLQIKNLLALTLAVVENKIKNKSVEENKILMKRDDDFTTSS